MGQEQSPPSDRLKDGAAGAGGSHDESGGAGLPVIRIDGRHLHEVVDDAVAALHRANEPPTLFQHGGGLVRMRGADGIGRPVLEPMGYAALREALSRAASWVRARATAHGPATTHVFVPMEVAWTVAALPDWPFPHLESVIEAPLFGPGGELIVEPGYHSHLRLWYHRDPSLVIDPVPTHPGPEERARARDLLLDDLLGDFPFVDDASRAHALAALLLPFLRPMIGGPTPLHLIEAPMQGTGKTLLAQVLCFPALGREPDLMTEGQSDEEWRKRITASLLQSSPFVVIDNLRRTLDSGALASAVTGRNLEDRILGASKMSKLPVRCCWLATGNNVVLSREFTRRTALIRLDAQSERPWLRRDFRHGNILAWAKAHRGGLVRAALTLIRAWIAEGRPPGVRPLGMFESWAETMGGILGVAGVPGFLGNLSALDHSLDEPTKEMRAFVERWWEEHSGGTVGVEDLFVLARRQRLLVDVLGDMNERSQRIRLGRALGRFRDQTIGPYHLEYRGDDHKRRGTYRLNRRAGSEEQ